MNWDYHIRVTVGSGRLIEIDSGKPERSRYTNYMDIYHDKEPVTLHEVMMQVRDLMRKYPEPEYRVRVFRRSRVWEELEP